ncbi:hypothetical protein F5Y04DRAFT_190216 [Hypomontagnella monticulosa]|nr:hypothetical protein F5Y04DRAFT_190216 [Hypomontagnella monticulosa]
MDSNTAAVGSKRKPIVLDDEIEPPKRGKQTKKSNVVEPDTSPDEEHKPRLTTPDLEFDYDRSQLRDPRPTPGRVKRPRYERLDMPNGFKDRFYIPEPDKPKGRLNALQKDALFKQQSLLDPSATFHDLNTCHRKGRKGSPTYDSAGFQLDWEKVDRWMKPQAYSRSRAVKGMEKSLQREEREERDMFKIFLVDGQVPENERYIVIKYLKDHVSKDLGVPWHQIGPEQLVEWEKKGFPKQTFEEWWREPNEVEKRRMSKMLSGASLRKDL